MATPTMSDSASGLSSTRASPNSFCNPSVTPKTPPLAPTSSPRIITRSSRCISSRIPSRIASMYVFSATPVTRLRVHVEHRRAGVRQRCRLRSFGGLVQLRHELGSHLLGIGRREHTELLERGLEPKQRIAFLIGLELLGGSITPLVVV